MKHVFILFILLLNPVVQARTHGDLENINKKSVTIVTNDDNNNDKNDPSDTYKELKKESPKTTRVQILRKINRFIDMLQWILSIVFLGLFK